MTYEAFQTYADTGDYSCVYQGRKIPTEDFYRYALKATLFLNYYTRNKAKQYPQMEELKLACCALAEQYFDIEQAQALADKSLRQALEREGPEMQSQTVGPLSKTYKGAGDTGAAALVLAAQEESKLAAIAQQFLAHTGLLYRGESGCRKTCFPTL